MATVCLGDVAATGPEPRQAIARLRELNPDVVMGNTDAWLLDPIRDEAASEDMQRTQDIDLWCASQFD